MASRIAGITIEIGGDTTNLQKSLKGVDSQIKSTQAALKDVNKLLKVDPTNIDLLRQKQTLLKNEVAQTKTRLDELKKAQAAMDAAGVDKNSAEYQALTREIAATEQALKRAKAAASGFSPALEKIKASAKKAADGLKKASEKTKALSTAATAALTAIGAIGMKALTTADDLLTLSSQTGLTTAEIQRFAYAADRVDVSVDSITKAIAKLKKNIDPSNKSLQKLGVSATNTDGTLRNATDVFYDVLNALSQVENETERDQLAMALFGKSADELAGIIDDGGAALKAYGDEAESLGLIMDEQTLTALGKMNDEVDKLKAQALAVMIQAGAKAMLVLSPVLMAVANAIGKVLEYISQLSPETLKVIVAILAVIAAISPVLAILSKLATGIAFLASPIGIAIAAIAAIIAIGVVLYKNWDTIKAKAEDIAKRVKNSWNNLKQAVVSAVNAAKTGVTTAWNNIKSTVTTAASNILQSVRTSFSNIKNAIASPFQTAWSLVQTAVNKIKGIFPISMGKIFSGIKLPHFRIDGGEIPWGIGGAGKKPSVNIDWYRKAMNRPYLLNGATIFGAKNGKLLGGGEAGKEVIMSYDHFRGMGGTTNVNVVVNAAKGMNEAQLADMVARKIQQSVNRKGAVWA